MKKLFKRDTILAMAIPFVFIWTSQPLGISKVMFYVQVKEYKVRSIMEFKKTNDTNLL